MTRYHRPESLDEALRIRAARGADLTIVAGGTDFYPVRTHQTAWFTRDDGDILDLTGIAELKGIGAGADEVSVGALATWTELARSSLPPAFDALKAASRQVGGIQVQNRGTIGGNLCNASPAADGVPPLLVLDAAVELASVRGRRRLPLAEFVLGNRRTALIPDEIVIAIHVPAAATSGRSTFLKLGARSYLVISIASVAIRVDADPAGRIAAAHVAVGACSAVPQRLPALERKLAGARLTDADRLIDPADLAPLSPIDDVRASADYRRHAALTLIRRALHGLVADASEVAA